jgi:hypothetical protein
LAHITCQPQIHKHNRNYEEDDIVDDEDVDEDFPGEVPNFNGEDVDYFDFLGNVVQVRGRMQRVMFAKINSYLN